jgi:uncharacterized membrane protein YfcA
MPSSIHTLAGFGVGFIVGLTGMGGGSLMSPLLVLFFRVAPTVAVGTDLLFACVTKMAGTMTHGRRGHIDWKVVGWLTTGSLPLAVITLLALGSLRSAQGPRFSAVVTYGLAVALILTAVALLLKDRLLRLRRAGTEWGERALVPATIATGAVLGVLVSLTSVGAGALGMVALVLLYPKKPSVSLVGIDIAHAVPLTAVAGFGHSLMGNIDLSLLISLLIGSVPGIYLGSRMGHRIPEKVLRPILASMLVLIGGRLAL